MKAWILAAVVAAALVLVGVPTVALAVALPRRGDTSVGPGRSRSSTTATGRTDHGWAARTRAGAPHGFHHGDGRHFKMHKLTAKQRDALADRLDQRATQLHKAATCLRQNSDAGQVLQALLQPPATAGMTETCAPSGVLVSRASRNRTSSLPT